jgi:hypothetical protein
LNYKTDYDEKVADVVCHCINFVSNVRDVVVEAVDGILIQIERRIYWPSLKAYLKPQQKAATVVENPGYTRT